MAINNHFEFILTEFLGSILRTIDQRYCTKFSFQREKARAEVLNTRLGI